MQTSGLVKLKWKVAERSENWLRKVHFCQENHAWDWTEIQELRRIFHEETERARKLRTQKKEESSTMNQLLSQIQTLQNKMKPWMKRKNFYDPATASSSGMSNVLSEPSRIPSPKCMLSRDCGLSHYTHNSMVLQEMFLKNHLLQREFSVLTRNCHETWSRIETRVVKFNNIDWRNLFSELYDENSRGVQSWEYTMITDRRFFIFHQEFQQRITRILQKTSQIPVSDQNDCLAEFFIEKL